MALTLEQQFAPVAPALESVAEERNLLIQRYRHDQPVWDLCFSHPSAGQAKVEVHRIPDSGFMVTGAWWVDDYDSATRRIKWAEDLKTEGITFSQFILMLPAGLGAAAGAHRVFTKYVV